MNLARFDAVCQGLPGAEMVVQWHGTHVFKLGEKMFAFANVEAGEPYFVFKTAPLSFEILLEQGIAIRAPYLPRGHWVRVTGTRAMKDADLAAYLKQSYEIVLAGLSRQKRRVLGIVNKPNTDILAAP
jgi:predicted DNA-binding protein (MmcQ/YjbR family)